MDSQPDGNMGFRILSELGRGTTGVVYRAIEFPANIPVAIKLPLPGPDSEREARANQFLQECRVLGSLRHPFIVSVYTGGDHNGQPYYAREFVDGDTLKARVLNGSMGFQPGLSMLHSVAKAVRYVHQQGFAHRNLRASNIMIDAQHNVPKLIGFGLAGSLAGSPHLQPGQTGTPALVDVQALGKLVTWLAATRGQPLPADLARVCEPGANVTLDDLVEALARHAGS